MFRVRERSSVLATAKTIPVVTVRDTTGRIRSQTMWPYFTDVIATHSCVDETHPGPPYRSGGPLGVSHTDPTATSLLQLRLNRTGLGLFYDVDFRPICQSTCPVNITALGDAYQYGATGWKRFKPGKTGASLGQFLGELKDLPSLFKFQVKTYRDLGKSYLNYQFGWKPFMNDLKSFFDLTKNLDRRFQYLKRNNNKFKKRGGTILEDSNTTTSSIGLPITPTLESGFYPNFTLSHTSREYVTVSRKVWFEALMRFYIPDIESPARRLTEVVRQFGLMPSPSLVYELTPWSWLIDYFSNLGDIIDNLSDSQAAPNLVALYAYVMNTTIITRRVSTSFTILREYGVASSAQPISTGFSQSWVSKARSEASPFGFSLSFDELSDYQLSILSALGISRFPKIR